MALKSDREIFEIAKETEHVTFQTTTRKTQSGYDLPMVVHDRLAFTPEEYIRRYNIIQTAMAEAGLDALLVRGRKTLRISVDTRHPVITSITALLCQRMENRFSLFVTLSGSILQNLPGVLRFAKVFDWDHPPSVTSNVLQQLGLTSGKRIGVEKQCFFYTVDEHETLTHDLPENNFVDATQILWDARMIKSVEEIEVMRKSAHLVDLAMQAGWDATSSGTTADEINGVVNKTLLENGGEYMGLPPFILAGERSCLPHQTGGKDQLRNDDVMYFEISASQHRYTAALMRTIFVGNPKDEWVRAAEACIGAVEAALETIKPGSNTSRSGYCCSRSNTESWI